MICCCLLCTCLVQTDANTPSTPQEEGHFDELDKRSEVNTPISEKQQEIQETSTNDNADGANSPPTQGKIVIPQTPQDIGCTTSLSTIYYHFIYCRTHSLHKLLFVMYLISCFSLRQ